MLPRLALVATLAPLALAACSRGDDEPAPAPSVALTPAPVPTAAADGTPLTPGKWDVGEDASGVTARYAADGAAPALIMRCDRNTRVLSLVEPGVGTGDVTVRIEAGTLKADVRMTAQGAPEPGLFAAIDPLQPIFTAWADPGTMIVLTGPGVPSLKLPGHAGLARAVAACS